MYKLHIYSYNNNHYKSPLVLPIGIPYWNSLLVCPIGIPMLPIVQPPICSHLHLSATLVGPKSPWHATTVGSGPQLHGPRSRAHGSQEPMAWDWPI